MSPGKVLWVRVGGEPAAAVELLKGRPEVAEAVGVDGRIKVTLINHDVDASIIAETLVHGGARLRELREEEIGLEEVFMRVTRGETQ